MEVVQFLLMIAALDVAFIICGYVAMAGIVLHAIFKKTGGRIA